MKINYDSPAEEVRIELIPLIDVIFCILTFFLLAALQLTPRQQAINVDLPKAETGEVQTREMLVVSIDQIGQTYVDKQPVTRNQLYQILLAYKRNRPEGIMVLYASKMASYNDVMQVLDLLRDVGGDRVALATLPDSGEQPATPTPNDPANQFGLPNPGTPAPNPSEEQPIQEGTEPGNDPDPVAPEEGN